MGCKDIYFFVQEKYFYSFFISNSLTYNCFKLIMLISQLLVNWYQDHHRDLPWRHTSDPYKIWLSEIILQQTRIDQGKSYYNCFIEKFPAVEDLAKAEEQEVLRLWQGLGYYSRARNLHKTAQTITNDYKGVFPDNYSLLLKLKGVGDYTASAIASHAFGLPYAVVDGNVYRFLSRYFSISKPIDTLIGQKYFKKLASELLDKQNPSIYNQAIMEFGALQCKPKNPDCSTCVLVNSCKAFAMKKINSFPVKKGKTKVRNRYFNYFILQDSSNKFVLKKRSERDIWQNLYDFPLIETEKEISEKELLSSSSLSTLFKFQHFTINKILPTQIHMLSHQKIHLRFFILVANNFELKPDFLKYSLAEITKLPLPRPIEKMINQF